MKMFGNLTTEGTEKVEDRVGGGFSLFESGAYEGIIKMAYVGESAGGAKNVNLVIDVDGKELRQTVYITNKKGENYYADKKDPKKRHLLPGFIAINDMCMMTTELGLAEQDVEEKVVEIYNFEERKMIPTNVPVLVDVLNKPILVAVVKQTVDKQTKQTDGSYANSGETRDENEIEKFLHPVTKQTLTEAIEGIDGGTYLDAWLEKNEGKVRNRAKGANGDAGSSGRPGASSNSAPAAGNAGKPKTSLFGAK